MAFSPLQGLTPHALSPLLLTTLLAAQALAQTSPATRPARPDPLDPKAPVPELRYVSSLAQTLPGGDDKPVSWRDANDAVARIGGWRVYAREALQADPARPTPPGLPAAATPQAPATTAPSKSAGPAGHAGHKP